MSAPSAASRDRASRAPPTAGSYGRFEYLVGPDGVKVELVTNMEPNAPLIVHHHMHFVNKQFVEMQQWYMKAFNATLRDGQTDFFIGADLPGVGYMLNFFSWLPEEEFVGTAGRAMDHVGFEVRDLEAFARSSRRRVQRSRCRTATCRSSSSRLRSCAIRGAR